MNTLIPEALKPVVTFFHPALMLITFGLTFYALYLGIQVRRTRSAEGATKKEMMAAKYNLKHFQIGGVLLVLWVLGTVGGMTVTYINNNKLFVGPHLIAGLGIASLAAISAALAPQMQQGKEWARTTHIVLNSLIVCIFTWQVFTGFEIIQRILDAMAKAA